MQPRVLFRTHYQVDEPALLRLLVSECTSPVKSAYDEVVAERLAQDVKRRGKEFNTAAAEYALDLARGLSILTDQNTWTEKGHLVSLIAKVRDDDAWEAQLDLPLSERLLFFRLFIEGDGAAIAHLSRRLIDVASIPNGEGDWNAIASEMFIKIYTSYLEVSSTTQDRVRLRSEVDRIRTRGYSGKSGPHKLFVHLQVMHRLGLAERAPDQASRRYLPANRRALEALGRLDDNVYELEQVVKQHRWGELASESFLESSAVRSALDPDDALRQLVPFYERVMASGTPLCPLSTLIEAAQIDWMTHHSEYVPYEAVLEGIKAAQRSRVRDVRFHVDRRGAPAFVRLSDGLVSDFHQSRRLA